VKDNKKSKANQVKKINIEFSDQNLTNYSGLVPISRFMLKQLKFKKYFSDELGLDRGSN